jgi:hypothetical protein
MRYLRHACVPSAAQVVHDALLGMRVYLQRLKGPATCVTAHNLERLVLVAVIVANKYLDRTQRTAGCFAGGSLALPRVWLHTHALQDDRLKHAFVVVAKMKGCSVLCVACVWFVLMNAGAGYFGQLNDGARHSDAQHRYRLLAIEASLVHLYMTRSI